MKKQSFSLGQVLLVLLIGFVLVLSACDTGVSPSTDDTGVAVTGVTLGSDTAIVSGAIHSWRIRILSKINSCHRRNRAFSLERKRIR